MVYDKNTIHGILYGVKFLAETTRNTEPDQPESASDLHAERSGA